MSAMAASSSAPTSSATASRCCRAARCSIRSEDGEQTDEGRYYYGNGSASYRPTDRQTITLAGTLAHTDFLVDPGLAADRRCASPAAAPTSSRPTKRTSTTGTSGSTIAAPRARQGEMLTASVKWARFSGDFDRLFSTDPVGGPANLFQQQQTMSDENWTGKVDYVRPLRRRQPALASAPSSSPPATGWPRPRPARLPNGAPFAASSLVDGSWFEYAGYVTYQFALAGFTIMPGVRARGPRI